MEQQTQSVSIACSDIHRDWLNLAGDVILECFLPIKMTVSYKQNEPEETLLGECARKCISADSIMAEGLEFDGPQKAKRKRTFQQEWLKKYTWVE